MVTNFSELVIGSDILWIERLGFDKFHVVLSGPKGSTKEDTYVSKAALLDFVMDLEAMLTGD